MMFLICKGAQWYMTAWDNKSDIYIKIKGFNSQNVSGGTIVQIWHNLLTDTIIRTYIQNQLFLLNLIKYYLALNSGFKIQDSRFKIEK